MPRMRLASLRRIRCQKICAPFRLGSRRSNGIGPMSHYPESYVYHHKYWLPKKHPAFEALIGNAVRPNKQTWPRLHPASVQCSKLSCLLSSGPPTKRLNPQRPEQNAFIPISYCLPWILETPLSVPVEEVPVERRASKCFWRPCPSSFPLLVFHWPTSSFVVFGLADLRTTSLSPRLFFPL